MSASKIVPIKASEAQEIGKLYKGGVDLYIECGSRLLEIKASMRHGQWMRWLSDNEQELGFGDATARRLIKCALTHNMDWGNDAHVSQNTGVNEWFTPESIIECARAVLGGIDLDPASHLQAQEIVKARIWFSKAEDGLKQPWSGRVWLNPPYSQPLIGKFVDKLVDYLEDNTVTAAITLTNNGTETAWGQALLGKSQAVCFPAGRIPFWEPGGKISQPLQGQMLCYFGNNSEAFAASFSPIGAFFAR